jgi:hypothetical protein
MDFALSVTVFSMTSVMIAQWQYHIFSAGNLFSIRRYAQNGCIQAHHL